MCHEDVKTVLNLIPSYFRIGDPFVFMYFDLDFYGRGSRYKQKITPKNRLDYVML
jgi:hypothetical protein